MAETIDSADFNVRAQATWDRWLRVHECRSIHDMLFGEKSPMLPLAPAFTAVEQNWDRLRRIHPNEPEAVSVLGVIEGAVADTETRALMADAAIPTAVFRQAFSEDKISYEAVVRYVQLLASRLQDATDRRDRVEFLATRLLTHLNPDGSKSMLARAAVDPVLKEISLGRESNVGIKEGALKHFQEATERTRALASVDDAFDSGLLLDLRGFKLSLGADLVDPDVLYAACSLNVEISNRLKLLIASEGIPPAEMARRYAELDRKLKEIFREARSFVVPEAQKFSIAKKPEPQHWSKAGKQGKDTAPRPSRRRIVLGGAVALLLVMARLMMWAQSGPKLVPLSDSEAHQLSPMFVHASRASYDGDPGLEAELASSWSSLNSQERRKTADQILHELYLKKIYRGVLWAPGGTTVAVRFVGGDVLTIE